MRRTVKDKPPPEPESGHRLHDIESAGEYLHVSPFTVKRLIELGKLPVIKLPVSRRGTLARDGANRRVLVDVRDLDKLIESSREYRR